MKVLVTGGAGYIGSHTVRSLVQGGAQVVVLDNLVYGHREALIDPSVELVVGDLGDREVTEPLFERFQPDIVVHFAAYAYVGESVEDPLKYYQNNLAAPLSLLEVMARFGCRRFIFSSTCATYGVPSQVPISEDTRQAPINPYGHSKRMLEQVLQDCDRAWGLKSVSLRYFNACGASLDHRIGESHNPETHLIPLILETALGKREHIKVFGDDYETPDGSCIRDYIHVEDLASAHQKACQYLLSGHSSFSCNLGTGQGWSVREVIEAARKVTGAVIPVVQEARREGDPPILVADPSLAEEVLGWSAASSDLETILETAWQWASRPCY